MNCFNVTMQLFLKHVHFVNNILMKTVLVKGVNINKAKDKADASRRKCSYSKDVENTIMQLPS